MNSLANLEAPLTAELKKHLTELRRALLTMSVTTEGRVSTALESLIRKDPEMARSVRSSDTDIDEMEVDIDEECLRILALHNPVASDLRFVICAMRVNRELERAADHAKAITKRVLDICDHPPVAYPPQLEEMAVAAQVMLGNAVRALAQSDASLASEVRRSDSFVDERYKTTFSWAADAIRRNPTDAHVVIDILSTVRAIERIGDIATNIAEDVLFMIGGQIVRHSPVA